MPHNHMNEELPTQVRLSRYDSWGPDEYYRTYYGQEVLRDDKVVLKHHIDFLTKAAKRFPLALEFGCGPTLLRAIAAVKYIHALVGPSGKREPVSSPRTEPVDNRASALDR